MRARFDAFMRGEADPFPGSSGSQDVENMVSALMGGRPNPYNEVRMATKVRARKPNEYPIVEHVARAFIELFEYRDRFENLKETP